MGHIVVAWLWLEQATTVGDRSGDFYDGKRAAAKYFMDFELPRVFPSLEILERKDLTFLELDDNWL